MTGQEAFDADLARFNAAIKAAGALIDHGDGTYGFDQSMVPDDLSHAYGRLLQYGYANGLIR